MPSVAVKKQLERGQAKRGAERSFSLERVLCVQSICRTGFIERVLEPLAKNTPVQFFGILNG